jgi:hypothetical protein
MNPDTVKETLEYPFRTGELLLTTVFSVEYIPEIDYFHNPLLGDCGSIILSCRI